MNALLGAVEAVGVLAAGAERRRLDPGFLARAEIEQLSGEAALLRPAHLHPQHHLGPILRVGAAGPGVDRHQRVAGVVAPGKQALLLQREQPGFERGDRVVELAGQLLVVGRQLDQRFEILKIRLHAAEQLEPPLRASMLGADLRRSSGVVPKTCFPHPCFERGDALGQRSRVKDSPRAASAGRGSPRDAPASALSPSWRPRRSLRLRGSA